MPILISPQFPAAYILAAGFLQLLKLCRQKLTEFDVYCTSVSPTKLPRLVFAPNYLRGRGWI